jgi:hypothetical protein
MKIKLKTEDKKTADQISKDLLKILNLNIKNSLYFIFYEQNKSPSELITEELDRLITKEKYKNFSYEKLEKLAKNNMVKYIKILALIRNKFLKLINLIEAHIIKSVPQKVCKEQISQIVNYIHKKVLKIKRIKYS